MLNANPLAALAPGVGQSSYVQLVISAQTQYGGIGYPAPQTVAITLFPAPDRAIGAVNLPAVRHPPLVRLWHFISDHEIEVFAVISLVAAFTVFKMLTHGRRGDGEI